MSNADRLVELAKGRFGSLNAVEEEFFRKVGEGLPFDRSSGDAAADDPAKSDDWGEGRKLRSELLEWVCTDGEASGLVSHRGVILIGVRFDDEVDLSYAQIGLPLVFVKCDFKEEIYLRMARLRSIDFRGSHIQNINGVNLTVEGNMFIDEGFCAEGEVGLSGAKVGGDLICIKGKFRNPYGKALDCGRIEVKGSVFLRKGFSAEGEVHFLGATVGFSFECSGSEFINPKGIALHCDGIEVKGNVFLSKDFKAEGEVRFLGATVAGTLDCSKGKFSNPERKALICDVIEVKGGVSLRNGFRAEGEVRFLGATVGNNLNCGGGRFVNPKGIALHCDGIKVKGNVYLRNRFRAEGKVNFEGAKVGGYFIWRDVESPEKVTLDLRSARVGTLWDEEKSWPEKGKLLLHRFVYDEINEKATRDTGKRLKWLGLQREYSPGPYEQLAKVLRESGHKDDAIMVLIAKNEDRVKRGDKLRWQNLSGLLRYKILGPMIGYGYRPSLALHKGVCGLPFVGSILSWILLGSLFFGLGFYCDSEIMVPSSVRAYQAYAVESNNNVRDGYPTFQLITYSVDAFVPVVDLHQNKYWIPNANKGADVFTIGRYTIRTGGLLLFYLWVHIAAGWVLSTLFVVGLTGMVRK